MRIFCVQVAEFPQASFTIHVRLMVPVLLHPLTPVRSSETEKSSSGVAAQLSEAVIFPVTDCSSDCSHEIVMAGGGVTTGFLLSMIVITWMQVDVLPHASVAVHVLDKL